MKAIFKAGDFKVYHYKVQKTDFAGFQSGMVHAVCSTFALGREMEWSSRLFILEMIDEDEEGIGTILEIEHLGPAFEGELLEIKAMVEKVLGNELICAIEVSTEGRSVASGRTGQKVLKKDRINQIFTRLGK